MKLEESYYKMYVVLLAIFTQALAITSCSQNADNGPGYRWELFKGTSSWNLAKAVASEDTEEIKTILKDNKINVNLQEPKMGRTVLMLAVGNDKERSVKTLLNSGANVNIRDSFGIQAIHEATSYIDLRKNYYSILKMLIEHGADVNSVERKSNVPLEGVLGNLACTKLLLDHGAELYFKRDNVYHVWVSLFINNSKDLNVAKYLIIERKMDIPDPIVILPNDHTQLDVFHFLKLNQSKNSNEQNNILNEIIDYLHKVDFPHKQIYKEIANK